VQTIVQQSLENRIKNMASKLENIGTLEQENESFR